ncbi:MAG: hypothetical protein OET44_20460 [Gammaproteobacteria bacterium]|nr:hypothetical protein [Gammaproteobacteria bacterium]
MIDLVLSKVLSADLRPYLRVALKLVLLGALLIGATYAGNWIMGQFNPHLTPSTEPAFHRMIMITMVIYVLMMALPFVPGAEIGLGLMVMFGPKIAPLVYAGTVLALSLAFLLGRLVPQQTIVEIFETLHLKRASRLVRRLEPLDSQERLEYLLQNASARIVPFLLRHRFLALAVALNLPGNALIGGGGGICLVAGYSRLFPLRMYLLTVSIAVSPIPLAVFVSNA